MSRGFAVAANVKAEVVAAAAREAEGAGYTSFWVNHPGPFDGLGALATAARETRRLGLGIGVIPLHTRGPQSIVEGVRYAAIPAYKANFDRMGVKPEATAIVADTPADVARALASWEGVIDEVILRALPADDGVASTLALVRAAKP